jgi:hypothetical protein
MAQSGHAGVSDLVDHVVGEWSMRGMIPTRLCEQSRQASNRRIWFSAEVSATELNTLISPAAPTVAPSEHKINPPAAVIAMRFANDVLDHASLPPMR